MARFEMAPEEEAASMFDRLDRWYDGTPSVVPPPPTPPPAPSPEGDAAIYVSGTPRHQPRQQAPVPVRRKGARTLVRDLVASLRRR